MDKVKVTCEIEVTINMIGGKWKPLILYYLINEGTKRFGELMNYIKNVSKKTLTNQLRELENDGLISREVFPIVPPKVEYSITEKGKSLFPILSMMCDWGYDNIGDKYELISPQCEEK